MKRYLVGILVAHVAVAHADICTRATGAVDVGTQFGALGSELPDVAKELAAARDRSAGWHVLAATALSAQLTTLVAELRKKAPTGDAARQSKLEPTVVALEKRAAELSARATEKVELERYFDTLRGELPEYAQDLDAAKQRSLALAQTRKLATPGAVARELRLLVAEMRARPKDPDAARQRQVEDTIVVLEKAAATVNARVPAKLDVKPAGKSTAVAVRMTNAPSTRLRISLDGERTGRHVELEWDPAVTTPLIQHVDLADDAWAISASVEPIFVQQSDGSVVIATQFGDLDGNNDSFTMVGTPAALVTAARFSTDTPHQVTMTGWPPPTLTFTCSSSALVAMDDVAFPAQASGRAAPQARSGAAPEIVTQTLSLLAEIAVERAKSGAMSVLRDALVDPLCSNASTRITLRTLHISPSQDLAFPRTCHLLEQLRLEDILSSGEALLRAFRDDGRYTLAPALVERLAAGQPNLQRLASAVFDIANRAIDRGTFDGLEAQLILDLVGRLDVLVDTLPALQLSIPPELDRLLAASEPIRKALCRATDVATCLRDLRSAVWTPHAWYTAIASAFAQLAQKEVDSLFDALAPVLEAHANVKTALCRDQAAADCMKQKYRAFAAHKDWLSAVLGDPDVLAAVAAAIREVGVLEKPIAVACQAKLAVAIVKKCAGASCTAAQISSMLATPGDYFKRDVAFPAALCWTGSTSYVAAPAELAAVQRIIVDGLELVDPVRLAQGQDRAVAAIELVVKIIERIHGARDARIVMLAEVASSIVRGQYDTALSTMLRLVEQYADGKVLPRPMLELAQLAGAVTSYTAVYTSTKSDDPKAAREARKKALESLIDAATDRRDRGRQGVLSIGSNVGLSRSYADTFDRADERFGKPELALRVPLGIAWQVLPDKWPSKSGVAGVFGLHLGVDLVDLGRFIHTDDTQDVHWQDFIAPGVEIGVLVGNPKHALNVTLHGSVSFVSDMTTPTQARWVYGIAVGYYVPFFDLN